MANDVSALVNDLLTRSLPVLRENAVLARTVTQEFVGPGRKGQTIDFPVPVAQTAAAITASNTPPANTDVTPAVEALTLDQHQGTRFHISDVERTRFEADRSFIPGQLAEAVKAIANAVDTDIAEQFKFFGHAYGTAGTTPFASEAQFNTDYVKGSRKALNDEACPLTPRFAILDPAAEGALLSLAKFTDADRVGDPSTFLSGTLGTKMGATWIMNQNLETHSGNAGTGWLVNQAGHVAVGDTTVIIDTGSGDPVAGDSFSVAGDTTNYSVLSYASNTITFSPSAKVAWQNNDAITLESTNRVVNAVYHPMAIGLATATFEPVADGLEGITSQIVDPISGIAMRLEVHRYYKQTTWELDALWGVAKLRDYCGSEIMG